ALGITSRDLRASAVLDASFVGNPESFDVKASISDGLVVYDRRPFQLGPVELSTRVRKDTTSLDLMGDILNLNLRSNSSPGELGDGINRHLRSFLGDTTSIDSLKGAVEMEVDMSITPSPILQQVFLEGLDQLDSGYMEVNFNEKDRFLTASLNIPYVLYNNIEIDSLKFNINAVE